MARRRYTRTSRSKTTASRGVWQNPVRALYPQPGAPFSRRYISDAQYQVDAESLARLGWVVTSVQRDATGLLVATYGRAPAQPSTRSLEPAPPLNRQAKVFLLAIAGGLLVFFVIGGILANLSASPASSSLDAYAATATTGQSPATATSDAATAQAFALSVSATATADSRIPTATPKPKPTATPKPKVPVVTGVNGNPWGYTFSPGKLIYSPPGDFCAYFNCIASFWNGSGYVEECQDATFSKSGGIQGSCSHHGGDWRALYAH